MRSVAVFGMGYVGCVTGACMSRDGHRVIGVDVDPNKVAELNSGHAPIVEPELAEILREQVQAGMLQGTSDVEKAVQCSEIALVSVGTPSAADGNSVCSRRVEHVIEAIGKVLRRSNQTYTVVVRSTLLPGILEERLAPLLEKTAERELGEGLWLCNNPEFLRESTAVKDYYHAPFVIVGASDPRPAQAVLALYSHLEVEKIVTDTRTAALVKYACNAFHAAKVAFANEIGSLAKCLGCDGQEVMDILCRDRKLNIAPAYLRPGFAFGGSCLSKDLRAVTRYAERNGLHLGLLGSILPSNEAHFRKALTMILQTEHRKIGVVGLSFKAGTDDLRESPLVALVETLLGRGFDIKIYDPCVMVSRLRGRNLAYVDRHVPHLAALLVDDPAELYCHASLLVLGTDVGDALDWQQNYSGEVLDLRRDLARPPHVADCAGQAMTSLQPAPS